MRFAEDVIDLCIRTQSRRLGLPDAPIRPEQREAMESALSIAADDYPAIMALLEQSKGVAVADDLLAGRMKRKKDALNKWADPIVEAVAREASAATGCEVTADLLRSKRRWLWLTPWRHEAWGQLMLAGMSQEEIGLFFGRTQALIGRGLASWREREWAARAIAEKEAAHG